MTKEPPSNLSASVHARLLNLARAGGRSFNDLMQFYAMERFLYRLSASRHSTRFTLKGALLLRAWDPATYRATRDIDLLGRMSSTVDAVVRVIAEICRQNVEPDGLEFDPSTVLGETIIEDGDYQGVRVTFRGYLGTARADMQIDVGFGDEAIPPPAEIEFPVLLDGPPPRLLAYAPETTIAEKFQVMLKRGVANSRMKDFHDIWWLSRAMSFEGSVLVTAVKGTCARRGTPVRSASAVLGRAFAQDPGKAQQWRAFRDRLSPAHCPDSFTVVAQAVTELLGPVAQAIEAQQSFLRQWRPPGPWT